MLVLSTMVSAIVEIFTNRFWTLRRRENRKFLERFHEDVIWPRFRAETVRRGSASSLKEDEAQLQFVITVGRDTKYTETECRNRLTASWLERWMPLWEVPIVERLEPVQFAERLADTAYAKAIAANAPERIDAVIGDVAQQFERFGQRSRQRFKDRAQRFSMIFAVLFCFLANVDAGRVFQAYMQDPALAEQIVKQYEQTTEALAAAGQTVAAGETAAAGEATTSGTAPNPDAESAAEAKARFEAGMDELETVQADLAALKKMGLPIGYDYFPGCTLTGLQKGDPETLKVKETVVTWMGGGQTAHGWRLVHDAPLCRRLIALAEIVTEHDCKNKSAGDTAQRAACMTELEAKFREKTAFPIMLDIALSNEAGAIFKWIAMVLLAGVLVGLGSPFWFSFFTSVSRLSQVAGAVRAMTGRGETKAAEGTAIQAPAADAEKKATPAEAFKAAHAARQPAASGKSKPRVSLDALGNPIGKGGSVT